MHIVCGYAKPYSCNIRDRFEECANGTFCRGEARLARVENIDYQSIRYKRLGRGGGVSPPIKCAT